MSIYSLLGTTKGKARYDFEAFLKHDQTRLLHVLLVFDVSFSRNINKVQEIEAFLNCLQLPLFICLIINWPHCLLVTDNKLATIPILGEICYT